MSSAACALPTCSNAIITAARSRMWRIASALSAPGSGSAGAASKVRRACERVGSIVAIVSRVTPATVQLDQMQPGRRHARRRWRNRRCRRPPPPASCRAACRLSPAPRCAASTKAPGCSATAKQPIASPGGKTRQPGRLLRRAAVDQQRLGREIDRRRKGHRRHRASEFLGQHADREPTQPGAAVFLGDRRAGPAHLGHRAATAPGRTARRSPGCGAVPPSGSARSGSAAPRRATASGRRKNRSSSAFPRFVLPDVPGRFAHPPGLGNAGGTASGGDEAGGAA